MRLEGTLDAFSLPDIFQLLSFTRKTGTLHLRRATQHGVVYVRDGAVTGARADAARQELGRRLVGAGLVDDDALADAVERVLESPGAGLGRALAEGGSISSDALKRLAAEQATDAVFDLLRWVDGDFAFVVDENDPDDLGSALSVEEIVAEGRRRVEIWDTLISSVPSGDSVVTVAPSPGSDPVLSREEWALLALVDGSRTVDELVSLQGSGEYVVVSAIAGLAQRGLVTVGQRADGPSALLQRHTLLAALEGGEAPAAPAQPVRAAAPPPPPPPVERRPEHKPVIPERPEPFTAERRPDYAEEPIPALARLGAAMRPAAPIPAAASASMPAMPAASAPRSTPGAPASSVGSVQGAHALQPEHAHEPAAAPSTYIDRDPSVNKSLLLRLIAGVRGL